MKCKNCTYWKKNTEEVAMPRSIVDLIGRISQGEREVVTRFGGECSCDKFVYEGCGTDAYNPPITDDMLVYGDYEGYSANFDTGPEFGCIHFKQIVDVHTDLTLLKKTVDYLNQAVDKRGTR